MVLSREIIAQIKDILAKNPQGLNITDIVREVKINRNTAGKYLDKMLVSGQVEMRHFGMAKIYALAHRVPLSSVLSISSEFIMQLDSGLRIVFVNGTFAQLLDTPAGDLVGKNIEYSPLVTAFDEVYDRFLLRVKDGLAGIEWSGELRPEKREATFSCRIAPTALDNGKKGVTVILEDITGQKQSEDALKESEERFRLAMDASNDGLWDWDLTTDTGYFSPGYYRMLGYEPGEFPATSKTWISLLHPDDLGHTLAVNKDCIENRRENFEAESRLKAKDGSWKWILSRGRAVKRDTDGRALRMIGTHVDLTERKRLEDITNRFGRILDHSLNEIYTFSADSLKFIDANFGARQNLGYTLEEMRTLTPLDIKPEFNTDSFELLIAPLMNGKLTELVFTTVHKRKDGSLYPVEIHLQLSRNETPPVFIAIARDITKRKAAEDALRESQEKYRILIETSFDGIIIHQNGLIVFANSAAARGLGAKSVEEILNKPVLSFVHPDFRDRVISRMSEAIKNTVPIFKEKFLRVDGSVIDVDVVGMPFIWMGEPAVHVVFRDITERERAVGALKESEEKFRSFVENANDIVFSLSPEGFFTYVSPNWTEILGYDTREVIGKPAVDFIHPDDFPCNREAFRKTLATGNKTSGIEYRIRHKDGSWQWHSQNGNIIHNVEGKAVAYFGIARNITEQKHTADALKASEDKFRRIFDDGPHGMTGLDPDGRFILVNRRFCEMLGYTHEELLTKSMTDVTHPDDLSRSSRNLHDLYAGNISIIHDEKQYLRKDGTVIVASVTVTPLRDSKNQIMSTISIIEDITQRKHSETLLCESERRFRELADLLPQSVWECDILGNLTFANSGSFDMYRYSRSDFEKGLTIWQMMNPADLQTIMTIFKEAVSNPLERFPSFVEYSAIRNDGSTFPIRMYLAPIIRDGAIAGMRGIGIDMTVQKQTEQALREKSEMLRAIFDSTFQFTALLTPSGTIIEINLTALDFIGVSADRVIGQLFWETAWWQGDDGRVRRMREAFSRAAGGEFVRFEEDAQGTGGSLITMDCSFKPVFSSDGKLWMIIAESRDITKRKQTENALWESEDRFRRIFENSLHGIAIVDKDYRFVMVNRKFCDMMGYTSEELLKGSFVDITHPDHLEHDLTEVEKIFAGKIPFYRTEKRYIKKDGSVIWGLLTVSPFKDVNGKIISTIAVVEAITEQKQSGKDQELSEKTSKN
ncbi:MAG TPA: PAS domain S-box protein [Methanoregula sp.]|nr:PAS domain S-box protein [Methanoregula sp.]